MCVAAVGGDDEQSRGLQEERGEEEDEIGIIDGQDLLDTMEEIEDVGLAGDLQVLPSLIESQCWTPWREGGLQKPPPPPIPHSDKSKKSHLNHIALILNCQAAMWQKGSINPQYAAGRFAPAPL